MNYQEFIRSKAICDIPTGIKDTSAIKINPMLFDFQRDVVRWALHRGRACIWADCGLGKTPMQLEWAKHVCNYTRGNVLIITTLAVSEQTAYEEAPKFGIEAHVVCDQIEVKHGINVTNYEKIEKFDFSKFAGVVLDESSILKNYSGATRNTIIDAVKGVPFRLACTATPAPNDFMELGNHAEFVGAMGYSEMLSMFFIHDGGDTAKWRLKGHAVNDFFAWVASWAVMFRKPSDLGYSDERFILPEIVFHQVTVKTPPIADNLFSIEANTLQERQSARRETIKERAEAAAKIIAESNEKDALWCVWCNLNDEADTIAAIRQGMINIQGSDSNEKKAAAMLDFAHGKITEITTKPKIAGMGINWQTCHNTIFLGLSDSYEQFYQAVRRFYRFGQKNAVNVYIVIADVEGAVVENIKRKEADANNMYSEMVKHMSKINQKEIAGVSTTTKKYKAAKSLTMPLFI